MLWSDAHLRLQEQATLLRAAQRGPDRGQSRARPAASLARLAQRLRSWAALFADSGEAPDYLL